MAAVIPRASEAGRAVSWRHFGALALLIAVVLSLYWPAAQSLHAVWVDGDLTTYTHGYLIAGLSCWLAFRERSHLAPDAGQRWYLRERLSIFAVLFATALLWEFMFRAGILIAVQLLLLPLIWLSIGAVFGRLAARVSLFPVAFLVFAIPIWDYLNPYVHELTVRAVRMLLRLVGIPVFFVGDEVHIPEGVFEIEDGCSGLHFLMVALAIGFLAGELRGSHPRGRVGWVVLAAMLAILVNWVRVSTIVLLGHYTDMQHYVVRVSHYYYGWALFAIALAVFFIVERRVALTPAGSPRAITHAPDAGASRGAAILMMMTIMVAAVPLLINRIIDVRTYATEETVVSPAGWTSQSFEPSDWHPVQVNADRELLRRYVRGDQSVDSYHATYFNQRPGKKLGGADNRLHGEASVLTLETLSTPDEPWGEMVITQGGNKSLLWFQYRVAGRPFVSATRAQFSYSATTLKSMRSASSDVRALRVRCSPECASARETLQQFISDER